MAGDPRAMVAALTELDPDVAVLRTGVADRVAATWSALGQPGATLTGPQRRAVAAEARGARSCALCLERRDALSPHSVQGTHDRISGLAPVLVDAIHRIAVDAGRLTTAWYDELLVEGVTDVLLVEVVAVVAQVAAIDALHRGLGLPAPALPPAEDGAAGGEISADVSVHSARVPTVRPDHATGELAELYARNPMVPNIWRALTLVPGAAVPTLRLVMALYELVIDGPMPEGWTLRSPQVEYLATTVADHHDCFY